MRKRGVNLAKFFAGFPARDEFEGWASHFQTGWYCLVDVWLLLDDVQIMAVKSQTKSPYVNVFWTH